MTTKTRTPNAPEKHSGPRQARGRMVSRSIATNEQLGSVSLKESREEHACKRCGSTDLRPWERHCLPCKIDATNRAKERRKADPIRVAVRRAVLARDGMVCRHCTQPVRARVDQYDFGSDVLELDHLKPISKGGKSTVANVVVSCLSCNRGRCNRPPKQTLEVIAEVA